MTQIMDGKKISQSIRLELANDVASLAERGIVPGLVVILVGGDKASATYVRSKERMAAGIGMRGSVIHLPEDVRESELLTAIRMCNEDDTVDAILVQLPLPPQIDSARVLTAIRPDKDVDGFHPFNVGQYATGHALVWPCTSAAILSILQYERVPIAGKTAVIVGRSQIVGWPTAQLLLAENATVIQCHRQTEDLRAFTRQADILVAAAGQAHLIGSDDVKEGAVVIDVGMNRLEGKLVGDVDFDAVVDRVSAITPVPGGVGPMTVTMLMYNTIRLCKQRRLGGEQ